MQGDSVCGRQGLLRGCGSTGLHGRKGGSSCQKSQCKGCWCYCCVLSGWWAIKNRPEGRLENLRTRRRLRCRLIWESGNVSEEVCFQEWFVGHNTFQSCKVSHHCGRYSITIILSICVINNTNVGINAVIPREKESFGSNSCTTSKECPNSGLNRREVGEGCS